MPQAFAETTTGPKKLFISRKLTHFVAADGSDTGPGTADRPWATINYAADHVEAGDTVSSAAAAMSFMLKCARVTLGDLMPGLPL